MKPRTDFKLYGILGYPLAHTLSPAMQEAGFARLEWKAYYLVLEVGLSSFRKLMRSLSDMALEGFNVTVPYKEEILPYLDALTSEARAVGAVNTVFRRGKKWVGANTDVFGFLTSLEKEGKFRPRGKSALVLGSGGAARAAVYGLARQGTALIQVANRHPARAERIVRDFRHLFPKVCFRILSLGRYDLKAAIQGSDLVVNATSVGIHAKDPSLVSKACVPTPREAGKRLLFFDVVYRPTRFLELAKGCGHKTLNGTGMLLYQGARALEYWTHRKPPLASMKQALFEALEGKRT